MTQQLTGQTLEVIRNQHKALLLQVEKPGEVDLEQVRVLLKTLAQAGTTIENAEDRFLLHELIRYWSSFINDKTGEFPATQLQPFDASLIHSKSTHRPKFFRPRAVESPEQTMEGQNRQSFLENRKAAEPPSSLISDQNRQRMLARVHSIWITGFLEHSLHGAALITLELREQSDLTENPWRLFLQEINQPTGPLPSGTRITQVYDNTHGGLLILGEPGSGKTTLLLELARDLLNRAQHDKTHPIPVVFNLSSWVTKQQSLTEWLIKELNTKYQVPRRLGQLWIERDQILPLLDGLDEVSPVHSTACVEAINAYRREHGLVPMVVCSRSADYLARTTRILLPSAIVIQPLTPRQIDDYLSSAGEKLVAVSAALREDLVLRELAKTPLMLSVLTLAYHGKSVEDILSTASFTTRQQQVLATYVQQMLQRRVIETHYTVQQTAHWLAWLARQLVRHSQVIFYIELMQPDWLVEDRSRRAYGRLAIQLPGMLIGMLVSLMVNNFLYGANIIGYEILYGLVGGLIGGLLGRSTTTQQFPKREKSVQSSFWPHVFRALRNGILMGLSVGLGVALANQWFQVGLIFGVGFGLGSFLLSLTLVEEVKTRQQTSIIVTSQTSMWHNLIVTGPIRNGLYTGLVVGISSGLIFGLNFGLSTGLDDGLEYGLSFGLIGVLLSMILTRMGRDIQLVEIIAWSWRSIYRSLINIRHLINTASVGVLIGLVFGLNVTLSTRLEYGLSLGLSFGLCYWLFFGLFQGVSSSTLNDSSRITPNQGIQRSARNSIIIGLISGCVIWLLCILYSILNISLYLSLTAGLSNGLSYGLRSGLVDGLRFVLTDGLLVGLAGGLLVGLMNGGLAFLRHSILRWLLRNTNFMPLNYPRFLNYASDRILLRKIGGGYSFVHRLLLEYFATLDTSTATKEETEQVMNVLSDENG